MTSFDPDEGLNLMKAVLYSEGFSLYRETWSDQPPIFTIVLSTWLDIFGRSVYAARVLVLLFSAVLLWSFYQIIKYFRGYSAAISGSLILIFLSNLYLKLSISVMIGLPSLALAFVSMYILIWYSKSNKNARKVCLFSSALIMSISFQIKLTSVLLVPSIITWIIYCRANSIKLKKEVFISILSDLFIWFFSLVSTYFILGFSLKSLNYEQLWQSHKVDSNTIINLDVLWKVFNDHRVLTALMIVGLITILIEKYWEAIIPLIWFVIAIIFLTKHSPIWFHHYIFIFIPMAWIASYSMAGIVAFYQRKNWKRHFQNLHIKVIFLPVISILLLFYGVFKIPSLIPKIDENKQQVIAIEILKQHKKSNQWVFVDEPIIAFNANLLVPPELAVMSAKRFASGQIDFHDIPLILARYQPDQILLSRFVGKALNNDSFKSYLKENYSKNILPIEGKNKIGFKHYLSKN
ncbi:MAG: glycosyltransferase family 39 protein [Cyanobacteria bacterium SBLK]|nr:glycosyltransferase family 39 protein [Cyanobacteria bacterium SBLK]